jgi:hypothetical protein
VTASRGRLRRLAGVASVALAVLAVAAAALLGTALVMLRAAPGEWSIGVPIGLRLGARLDLRHELRLSVPALARVATHPLGIGMLDGRRLGTPLGALDLQALPDGTGWRLRCAPCRVDAAALASGPILLASMDVRVQRADFGGWHGDVALAGRGGAPVRARWTARLGRGDGELALVAEDQPAHDWVALLGAAVLPEARATRIRGTAGGTLRLSLPAFRPTLVPRLAGLEVEGFGTEALLASRPALPACARLPRTTRSGAAPFGAWLPRAVVAAEDQRFFEHPGWDLAEMAAAWSTDAGPDARRRGASTVTQQLARLLVTGDAPTAARKVRELLVAAELERTLGKARILELYLAIAPWGDGQCGAEAAALHLFGRPAVGLERTEAVWLASLLRNPDLLLDRAAGHGPHGAASDARLAAIATAMRIQPASARAAFVEASRTFVPPPIVDWRAAARGAAVTAPAPTP